MQTANSEFVKPVDLGWPELKQVIVGFEIAEADNVVLDYLNMLVKRLSIEEVHFVHVVPPVQLFYDSIEKKNLPEWGGLSKEVMDSMRMRIRAAIDKEHIRSMTIDIRIGDAFDELLNDADRLNADLLIIGQSAIKSSHAVLARKLARQTSNNVLVIPDYSKPTISKILVPIDFSDLSAKALKMSVALAEKLGTDAEVHCMNVVDVPPVNWARIQKSEDEMVRMLNEDRKMALEQFIAEHVGDSGNKIKRTLIRQMDGSIGKHITDHAEGSGFDLIMMGAKGHSPVASLLLGSVAEKVLSTSDGIPVMIVR